MNKTAQPNKLENKIRKIIAINGPISIAEYMHVCLCDPEFGYYNTVEPFGPEGDFITAPETSQMFGELVGAWCLDVWERIGAPCPLNLLELGPGKGTLMLDILRVAKVRPNFLEAVKIHLVETSQLQRKNQQKTLKNETSEISWHYGLSTVPDGPFIVIANEFLDALPIRQFVFHMGSWHERVIGVNEGEKLEIGLKPGINKIDTDAKVLNLPKDGDIVEISLSTEATVKELTQKLVSQNGIALFIDYGYLKDTFGDTLQSVKNHKYASILDFPGEADLTAHVNFQALARIAQAAGAFCHGPVTQAHFLRSLGLIERAGMLGEGKDNEIQKQISRAVGRLIGPDQMGELFKVIAISSAELEIPGFSCSSSLNESGS